jgi:superfamily II DNA helicase RecQ
MEYRHHFDVVKSFAGFAVQKIYLSATLPPRLMPIFLMETALPDSTLIIMEPTFQTNHRYHVIMLEPAVTTKNRFIADLAKYLTTAFLGPKRRRGIIFCTSINDVEVIGDAFNNCISHSKMDSTLRLHNEEEWYSGISQWIVATTGLIHGVDNQEVGAILFAGLPFGAMNLYQGSGRGGRNGEPAMVFLVDNHHLQYCHPKDLDDDLQGLVEGDIWMRNTEYCRRLGLGKLMDGKEVICADLDHAQLCDICDPNTELIQAVRLLIPDTPNTPSTIESLASMDDYNMDSFDDNDLMAIDIRTCPATKY